DRTGGNHVGPVDHTHAHVLTLGGLGRQQCGAGQHQHTATDMTDKSLHACSSGRLVIFFALFGSVLRLEDPRQYECCRVDANYAAAACMKRTSATCGCTGATLREGDNNRTVGADEPPKAAIAVRLAHRFAAFGGSSAPTRGLR